MIKRIAIFLSVVIFLTPMAASAFTPIDLYDAFPKDNDGTGGFWGQYAPVATPDSFFVLPFKVDDYYFGNNSHPSNLPIVARYTADWVFIHPYINENAVLTWTVSESGLYNIIGQFKMAGFTETGVNVYIGKKTGTNPTYFLSDALINKDDIVAVNLLSIELNVGDTLFFMTSAISGNSNNDWAILQGTISQTPIPGAVWLMGSGLLGLVGFRRFRRS